MTCAECELHKENNLDLREENEKLKLLNEGKDQRIKFLESQNEIYRAENLMFRNFLNRQKVDVEILLNKTPKETNVLDIPLKCSSCESVINAGTIFYKHKIHGTVCEHCPEFIDGGIKPIKD